MVIKEFEFKSLDDKKMNSVSSPLLNQRAKTWEPFLDAVAMELSFLERESLTSL